MKILAPYSDFANWALNKCALGNADICVKHSESEGIFYWEHLKYLEIGYPAKNITDESGELLFDNGYSVSDSDWLLDQLKFDPDTTNVDMFVGRYVAGVNDEPGRFIVQADKTATHVLLWVNGLSWGLMPDPSIVKGFCKEHNACLQIHDEASASYWLVLPITDGLEGPAVWHIWSWQFNEEFTDAWRQTWGTYDGTKCYMEDTLKPRLAALKNGSMGFGYKLDANDDTCTCEFYHPLLNNRNERSDGAFDLCTKSKLREALAAIILFENVPRPLTDFYGQPEA